ncbi:aminotransferase [Sulfitobacter sp. SK012]|uniref:cysteine desulfurase family protein n=1 Tax=Sulfitobacter sp. SK012 TaxID=1389005 RepID=UPI000E0A5217|nr:cysteine desulfurase family protein [Sulfitobacter sp. SK012]AXI46602.1 aminotransferase [Sulfitobacter sp. SK012]
MSRIYLDHNATTPLRAEARAAMVSAMDVAGNPSSVHAEGRAAKALVERARMQVAELVGCDPGDVVFTSGATEAASLAIPEFATVSSAGIEHDAVLSWVQKKGVDLTRLLDVDGNGVLTGTAHGADFADGIFDDVVAIQAANSETGVMQDTMKHAQALWALKRSVLILVDAVQALGKTQFSMAKSGADFILSSAHKLGGPKGIGALIVKGGTDVKPRLLGGGQEMGRRSGTENIVGIAGFGAAAEAAARDVANGRWEEVARLRDLLEEVLEDAAKTTILVGKDADRLPNTSCLMTPGWKGETQVMQMDLAGIAISAGSACSSGKLRASSVLTAMGYDANEAASAIRVSLGLETTPEDVMRFTETWTAQLKKHEKRAA